MLLWPKGPPFLRNTKQAVGISHKVDGINVLGLSGA